jgi:hypothetical protein
MPKRNFTAIREHLRNCTARNEYQAYLCAELSVNEAEILRSINDKAWARVCDQSKAIGDYHADIGSPALPLELIAKMAVASGP